MFADAWAQRSAQVGASKKAFGKKVKKLESEIDRMLDRIAETSSNRAAVAYERKVDRLEEEKLLTQEKLAQLGVSKATASKSVELALGLLSNPWKIWNSGDPKHRKLVLKLAFADRITYKRGEGYRTKQPSVIFRFLDDFQKNCEMVPGGGIEPPTRGFSIHCSTPELPGHGRSRA